MASTAPGAENSPSKLRLAQIAFWAGPTLLALLVYIYSFEAWFFQDDFVWLGLRDRIHDFGSFLREVFTPTEHGTFRPLSERLSFVVFSAVFGLNALPFRIWSFLTFSATLVLLSAVMLHVTGSRIAAFLAPVIWTANACMMVAMTWNSAYMQILCAFFILLAFYFFLRFIETGNRRYYWAQIAVFATGFGVMETNIVYPGIAAAYAWLFARPHFRRTIPLVAISVLFFVLHMNFAPKQVQGPYSMRLDEQILTTLWTYWSWALLPLQAPDVFHFPPVTVTVGVVLLTAALGAFLVSQVARRQYTGPFLFAFFLALVSPVLPLGGLVQYYYLTLPMMGLAAFGAYAFARAWASSPPVRVVAVALLAVYLVLSIPVAFTITRERVRLTQRIENMVNSVVAAHRRWPEKTILLTGVDNMFFWQALYDRPFRAAGVARVFLLPGERSGIHVRHSGDDISPYFLPSAPSRQDFLSGKVVVFNVSRGVSDVTARLARSAASQVPGEAPRRVDAGNPLQASQFGSGWHQVENGYRWMAKRGIVTMGGPRSPGEQLHVSGYCQAAQVAGGPLMLNLVVNGVALKPATIRACDGDFQFAFDLPRAVAGKPAIKLAAEVNKTFKVPGDDRELGLVFGIFEIR